MRRIVFLAPAEEEMLHAAGYYDNQTAGLGSRFLSEVRHTVKRISENPKSGQIIRGAFRRRLVRRFPFGILYRIDPEEIVIVAVMHLLRHPSYWADRI